MDLNEDAVNLFHRIQDSSKAWPGPSQDEWLHQVTSQMHAIIGDGKVISVGHQVGEGPDELPGTYDGTVTAVTAELLVVSTVQPTLARTESVDTFAMPLSSVTSVEVHRAPAFAANKKDRPERLVFTATFSTLTAIFPTASNPSDKHAEEARTVLEVLLAKLQAK